MDSSADTRSTRSALVTTTTCWTVLAAAIAPTDHSSIDRPRISSLFLSPPPMRELLPAATITASAKGARRPSAGSATRLSEDHSTGDGLQHAHDGHLDLPIDHLAAAFDHDHRPVV